MSYHELHNFIFNLKDVNFSLPLNYANLNVNGVIFDSSDST